MKKLIMMAAVMLFTGMTLTSCTKEEEPEKKSTSLPESHRQVDPGNSIHNV
jgi:hypothetical protein